MSLFSSAPQFSTRVPVQFVCTDVPALSIVASNGNLLLNNPAIFNVNTGSVMKMDQGVDGLSYVRGTTEYAPFSLDLEWAQIGLNDYKKLAALSPYYIHFISYRNVGYYGRMLLSGLKSVSKSADVLKLQAQFLPLAPSDQGGAATVNRISAPSSFTVTNGGAGTGYIPANAVSYYWLAFGSKYGQTTPTFYGSSVTTSAANTRNTITWTWPATTAKCDGAYLYVSNQSSSSTARLVGSVPTGLSPTWVDYVGYLGTVSTKAPQTVSTAYRGDWQSGIWFNEA
jgi:hypothetical protein